MTPIPSLLILAGFLTVNAAAQTPSATAQQPQSTQSESQDMSTMDHSKMGHAAPNAAPQSQGSGHTGHAMPSRAAPAPTPMPMPGMDHAAMGHGAGMAAPPRAGTPHGMGANAMSMGPMQGGKPPPDARDPNAYNEGTRHANLGNHEMNDNAPFGKLLVDEAELATGDGERGQNVEAAAWYGNDYDKAWVKVEGERRGGALESGRTELLWDHTVAAFWSTQLGVRHDSGQGGGRNWLAFGVQGLAPYWFETEATAYLRSGGGLGARLNVKYEVLFSSRLILEPELGANLYSRADPEKGTGKGLSDINAGLRLRYEITRKIAPYIGVTWNRQFGETADMARVRGSERSKVQAVAGVRLWF
jgi:copper resistance protein B